ncbi:extracellular solute-binding protein [Pseudovibrio sp. Tun.PSC04-5.I4]|uniref:extracellular solute-binding protein n=1 Tax=Pseudovibrio sp. Tun.PSC04-5.I4 TaxID=1798213 RepID=UPI000891A14C|nr:extracellular solute-binding protein [Pseudovibrio sp. Tun.PSC04-5.I4]SDQ74648.1 carbohydrate ABC transporter substrate-binding protein, CUT1 family [Pseudovibrio sp. Tun.PSC04-5.I4]
MIEFKGMTWDHPRGIDPLIAASQEYSRRNSAISFNWEKRSLQAFGDQPLDTMAATYDFMVIDHPHVGEASEQGILTALDLPEYTTELADLALHTVGASHLSYQWKGKQWALAIDAAAQVAARRRDLHEKPVTTWDDVIHLAETGKVLFPLKPVDAIDAFMSLCANVGDPCAETDDFLVSRATGLLALENMRAVSRNVDNRCFEMNPIGALDIMSTCDDFVYAPMLFGYVNYAQAGFRKKIVHQENMPSLGTQGPEGSIIGGTGISVSSKCEHQAEAIKFAYWLASKECQTGVYVQNNGQPAHSAAWDDAKANSSSNNWFRNTRETLDRCWLRPRYAGFLPFIDEAGDFLTAFVRGDGTATYTLDAIDLAFRTSLETR